MCDEYPEVLMPEGVELNEEQINAFKALRGNQLHGQGLCRAAIETLHGPFESVKDIPMELIDKWGGW